MERAPRNRLFVSTSGRRNSGGGNDKPKEVAAVGDAIHISLRHSHEADRDRHSAGNGPTDSREIRDHTHSPHGRHSRNSQVLIEERM
jgi:hypothetical protein